MAFTTWRELSFYAILLVGLAAGQTFPDLSECGKDVGCFRFPAACSPAENCTSVMKWRRSNESEYISFDLMAVSDGWVAVGFSNDSQMGNDSVVDCIRSSDNNDSVQVGFSYNSVGWNDPITTNSGTQYLKDVNGSYVNGVIVCHFQRSISGDDNKIFSLDGSYYLLFGYGPANAGFMQQHRRIPEVSPIRVNVTRDFVDIANPFMVSTQPPPMTSAGPTSTPAPPDVYPCSQPANCISDGNGSMAAFGGIPGTDQVLFNMTRVMNDSSGWLALGFSTDRMMGNDSCLDCILLKNGTIIVQHSYKMGNTKYNYVLNSSEGITVIETSYKNGSLTCYFKRKIAGFSDPRIFSLEEPYYLLLVKGPVDDNGVKMKNTEPPFISANPVDVRAVGNVTSGMTTSNPPSSTGFSPYEVFSFKDPASNNEVMYQLSEDGTHVVFTIRGPSKSSGWWIAVGFSHDQAMGDDSVLACILYGNQAFRVIIAYNTVNKTNEEVGNPDNAIPAGTVAAINGSDMTCKFKRKISGFNDSRIFPFTQNYYLLLASGPINANGTITKHLEMPAISPNPVDVSMAGNRTTATEPGFTTLSNTPSSLETPAPPQVPGFSDPRTNNSVMFQLSEDGARVNFTIRGPWKSSGWWIAVGFSYDAEMGDDSVLDCIALNNGTFRVHMSYNGAGKWNEEIGNPDSAISDVMTAISDGVMTCNFTRKISGFNDSRVFPFTRPFYLLLASGPLQSDGKKAKHTLTPFISPNPVYVGMAGNVTSGTEPGIKTDSYPPTEPGITTDFYPPVSTETPTPSKVSRFSDPQAKNEVLYQLSDDETRVDFTLRGPWNPAGWWIGVGFSYDQAMGDDSVLECIALSNGTLRVQISYNAVNKAQKNEEVGNPDYAISDVMTATNEGFMTCNFTRKISGFNDSRIFPFTRLFYLLLASGPLQSDGTKAQHASRSPSPSTLNITSTVGRIVSQEGRRYSNAPDPIRLLRAHGVLMITTFVMLMSGAIILARYYKTCWPEDTICGTAVWFAVHRFLMVVGLFCCAAGFIIIFCYSDGLLYRSFASGTPSYFWVHGPLGIIVMILIIINPIMALFRCDPDHDYRWIYNWLHFIVGMSCQILAGITLFFGIKMGEIHYNLNHMAVFWLLIAFVAFHCFIEFILIIEKLITQRQTPHSFSVSYGMSEPGEEPTAVKEGKSMPTRESLMFRYFVLALYTMITMGLWLAMIILIGGSFHTS